MIRFGRKRNSTVNACIYWSIFGAKWKYIILDRRRRYTYYSMLCYLIQLFDQLQMALDTSQAKPNLIPQSFKRIDKHLWVYAVFYQYHTYSWYRIFNDMIGHSCCSFCFVFCQTCLSNQLIVLAPSRLSPYVPNL